MRKTLGSASSLLSIQIHDIESRLAATTFNQHQGRHWLIALARGNCSLRSTRLNLELEGGQIAWIPEEANVNAVFDASTRAIVAAIPPDVLIRTMPDGAPGEDLPIYLRYPFSQTSSDPNMMKLAVSYLLTMKEEVYETKPGSEQMLSNICSLLFVHVWRHLHRDSTARPIPRSVVDRFIALERRHRTEHMTIGSYADKIGVTRDKLAAEVRKATGLSPRAYMHRELMREARELLEVSALQVAQIAFRLGFSDPAYFNRFFTRYADINPGKYRNRARRQKNQESNSFASWP
ncbi:helix-turn-helix domain-containing protein [Labrenzia sp. PHM005]|uniref:helix-turn-helix domain-containing protein n=1 Tax=Labrenzia sp. PHM005 TaxID=2590016 RepID=UPI00143D1424|nr:helix-turn-helix domain-containing protein [Labrenzia sp. PHM005]